MRFYDLSLYHHNIVLSILLIFTMIMVASTASNVRGNETDRLALLAIKAQILYDPFQITGSWNESLHFCLWEGVSCGPSRNQRVTQLNLTTRGLRGTISPTITNLSFIQIIDLSNNSFTGEIPSDMGRLIWLQKLVLGPNSLSGQIPPDLSLCSDLRHLYLWYNNFRGQIPKEISLLAKLEKLYLRSNNLTGNIPPDLGNLSALTDLDLVLNSFEGQIPDSLGRLKNLELLQISSNGFSGKIPMSIYNLSKLAVFFAPLNQLEGQLPRDIGLTLPNIEKFVIWRNRFGGTFPVSFSNMSKLSMLNLANNGFFGGVPDIFGNLKDFTNLQLISTNLGSGNANDLKFFNSLRNCSEMWNIGISGSNFGGTIPTVIANFSTRLYYLSIGQNPISGKIPPGIGNLIGLSGINAEDTLLSGTIPETIGKLKNLNALFLSNNRFSGEIPDSLGNLTSLIELRLGDNDLEGIIPSSLSNCMKLVTLNLSNNALNGTIPKAVIGMPSLSKVLNLSRNRLVGSLPSEVGELVNLGQLDISHNQLSGVIPQRLGDCVMMQGLYMDNNLFQGTIPDSLRLLRSVEEIDLSHNNLSGEIPKEIAGLAFLSKLDLSFNDLEGEIPTGRVFGNASAVSVTGNPKLCGGIPQLRLKPCAKKKVKKQSSFHRWKMIISIVFGVMALSLFIYFLFNWWFKKQRKQQNEAVEANTFATISYGDLLKATGGFSSENLIGVGSIGSVYKGILEADQTAVAVKVFNLQKRGASKSFASECETLRGVRHRNLVKVITACSSTDYQGNEFKALVYKLMPNGNLENLLHPNQKTEDSSSDPLTLSKRVDIAIGVASAVDYLHNQVETPILHCDLKPSNILLDQENIAHVGDFGLSRIVPQVNAEISNNQSSSSGLKGTIGYAAPEYGMGSKVSKDGDMYSFGILLLEIFTGKRPTDSYFGQEMNLNQFVKGALPERVMEIVDQGIFPREDDEATRDTVHEQKRKMKMYECCVSVLRIGVICSDEFPRARMKIDEALKQLYAAKKMLL